ncbi:YoaK family protein [Enterococcus sp. DIV0756]|uniref:YoaK family protein n=1 Tax=Enterococcus sp. DIV0756 TaxID=2774636 RepID=UPI003F1FA1A3
MEEKIHERLEFGMALAATAGGLDAYTYLVHGEVFAGLQTGNFILLGVHLGQGHWRALIHYLIPILAFALGALLARYLQTKIHKNQQLWFLTFEISLLLIVGIFSPQLPNLVVNALLSIAAATQLQEFQRLKGKPFTSLMMTGNLRNLSTNFFEGFLQHDAAKRIAFRDTLIILSSFVLGALLNGFLVTYFNQRTILFSLIFLGLSVLLLLNDRHIFR